MYCPSGYIDEEDGHGNFVPGAWRSEGGGSNTGLSPIGSSIARNRFEFRTCTNILLLYNYHVVMSFRYSRIAGQVRDQFADYCFSPVGEVSWQNTYINRTA